MNLFMEDLIKYLQLEEQICEKHQKLGLDDGEGFYGAPYYLARTGKVFFPYLMGDESLELVIPVEQVKHAIKRILSNG